jgi:hypothetical protein
MKATNISSNNKKETNQGLAKDRTREGSKKTSITSNLPKKKAIKRKVKGDQERKL